MNNKEFVSIAMAAVLTVTPLASVVADKAEGAENVDSGIELEMASEEYFKTVGKVKHINKNKDGGLSLLISEKDDNEFGDLVAFLNDDVLLLNSKGEKIKREIIKEGDQLEVFVRANTPVTSSLPPQTSPQVIVLKEDDSFVNVDRYNEDLVNQGNNLKLNISEDSELVDLEGNKLEEEDLYNRDLVVFYGPATFSIPAQTNPIKVIALDQEEASIEDDEREVELTKLVIDGEEFELDNEAYDLDGNLMLPLREIVEKLGYEVEWNNSDRSIELKKGALWHRVKIGDNKYNFAKMMVELEQAPVLKDQHTFVPLEFFEEGLRLDVEMEDGLVSINQ